MKIKLKNTRRINVSFVKDTYPKAVEITLENEYLDADWVYQKTSLDNFISRYQISDSTLNVSDVSVIPILDKSEFPILKPLASGYANVVVSTPFAKKNVTLDFLTTSTTVTKKLFGYKNGSPAKLSYEIIQAKLAANIPRDHNYYNQNNYSLSLVKNLNCWAAGFDFSCVPIKHIDGGFSGGGVAITKRHVLTTHHFTDHANQTEFKFLANDGTIVTRSVIGRSSSTNPTRGLFDNNGVKVDTHVYTLASDLPNTVAPAKVAGEWVVHPGNMIGNLSIYPPMICLGQDRKARIAYVHMDQHYTVGNPGVGGYINGVFVTRQDSGPISTKDWNQIPDPLFDVSDLTIIQGGSSGSPFFVPTGGNEFAFVALASFITNETFIDFPGGYVGGFCDLTQVINACILSADANAQVTLGLSVTVAPKPI